MAVLVYLLLCLLAFVYAVVAWMVSPRFFSSMDLWRKSPARIWWGRFCASWLIFFGVVILIPRNWHDFSAVIHGSPGIISQSNTTPAPQLNSNPTPGASVASVSKPVEQAAGAPDAAAPQSAEAMPVSETSEVNSQAVASSEVSTKPSVEAPSEPAAGPVVATPAPSETFAPSFNCAKASKVPERIICSNPQLSSLDGQLMQSYRNALSRTTDKKALKASSREWIKSQRDACGTADCMISAYQERIKFLDTPNP